MTSPRTHSTLSGNTVVDNGRWGIYAPSGYAHHLQLTGNVVAANGRDGIDLMDAADISIVGNVIAGNGQSASATYDGVVIRRTNLDPKGFLVADNIFTNSTSATGKPRYCFNMTYTTGEKIAVRGNIFGDFVSGAIADSWGGIYAENNMGHTAEISVSITTDQNNWYPTGFSAAGVIWCTPDTARTITGLSAQTQNRRVLLWNASTYNLTLSYESASSVAANRFLTRNFSDVVLGGYGSAWLVYSAAQARWLVLTGA